MTHIKLLNIFTFALTSVVLSTACLAKNSLIDVYLTAVDNDPSIKAEYSLLSAQRNNQDRSSGRLLPSVILSGELARNREEVTTSGVGAAGLTYFDSNVLELTINQPLYRKDLFTEVDLQQARSDVAEYEYRTAEQDFIMRVVQRYLAVLVARNDLYYLEAEKSAIREQLNNAKKRHLAGISTNADLYEAQASHDLAEAQAIVAIENLHDANAALEEVTNTPQPELADLSKDFIPVFAGPDDIKYWIEIADNHNPKLKASRYRVSALQYELDKSTAGHYPRLDVVAKYSTEDTGGRFGESETDDQSIALKLVFPIYEGGTVNASIRESNDRLNAEKQNLDKTHRQIIRQVNKTFSSISSTINRVKALRQAVKSSESALSAIKSGYKAGSRTSSNILDAQRELFKSKRNLLQEQYKFVLTHLELKQLAGSLSINDIQQVNQWFH